MRALLLALAATACTGVTNDFVCATDADCTSESGALGRCEFNQRCSYADTSCESGFRFGGFAGNASNQCTAAGCTGELSAGPTSTCILAADNAVWCWGDGMTSASKVDFPAGPIAQLDNKGGGRCVRYADNTVTCAGSVAVSSFPATDVAVGADHACAVTTTGVSCWGKNDHGQLGDNTMMARTGPVSVQNIAHANDIASGVATSCAINDSGNAWCWGNDSNGQLGRGPCAGCATSPVPVEVVKTNTFGAPLTGVTHVAVGNLFSCAIAADHVWCWGFDQSYQCGTQAGALRLPEAEFDDAVQVPGLPAGIGQVTVGDSHACALDSDHQVWCWGANTSHEAAAATQSPVMAATKIVDQNGNAVRFHDIHAGSHHTCGRRQSDGTVMCWGDNSKGQLGDGTTETAATPKAIGVTCH